MKKINTKLDLEQFKEFKRIGVLSLSNYLWKNRDFWEKQKISFLKNNIKNPDVKYAGVKKEKINKKIVNLKVFLEKIEKDSPLLQAAYLPKIKEKIVAWEALAACLEGADEDFSAMSKKLFGVPEPQIFREAVGEVRKNIKKSITGGKGEENQSALEVAAVFPEVPDDLINSKNLPPAVDIKKVRHSLEEEFPGIFELIHNLKNEKYNAREIAKLFTIALKKISITDWDVEVRYNGRGAISVDVAEKKVFIPSQRVLRGNLLGSLLIHEVGTHLVRARNGSESPLLLLGRGLDHYETAEEGIATVREQAVRNKIEDFEGLDGYLAVSLALGMDGKPRNFRQLYEVIQPYLYWRFVKKGYQTALTKSKNWAWYRCLRVFLGTSGLTPGACYTKDIIYRAGNIKIWNLIKQNPESLKKFNIGKFDPTNQAHLKIIKNLGL